MTYGWVPATKMLRSGFSARALLKAYVMKLLWLPSCVPWVPRAFLNRSADNSHISASF